MAGMRPGQGAPVFVLNTNVNREEGRKAQLNNIAASKAVAEVIRTCLGPRAMLKMILDPMGGIALTNDGNAILREIDVSSPAAKSMIELSRAQDENVGDGTTSVIILAGEFLNAAEPWLTKNIHPRIIIDGYTKALEDALDAMEKLAIEVDLNDPSSQYSVHKIVKSSIGTKFVDKFGYHFVNIAVDAVKTVLIEQDEHKEIDIKRYVRIEKIPGGEMEDSYVLKGCILNKDVTHAKMRRRIENPRILLLDCPLEYKKAESKLNVEISRESDWTTLLQEEEEAIMKMCKDIIKFKPDLVITEKGLSDLAQHIFVKHNITALRRAKKTDNNRIARASGATIVHRTDEIQESDIGTYAGLFEVRKIGDEYFSFIEDCKDPKAATIILRGANKDILNEVERNLLDALNVARNVLMEPKILPGGGATEMAVSQILLNKAKSIEGIQQWTYKAIALGLEVIPRTLAQNCGAKVVRLLTELRAKHAKDPKNLTWGVDGKKGVMVNMEELGVWDALAVKSQTIKTAVEAACMILRVDDILSGISKKKEGREAPAPADQEFE